MRRNGKVGSAIAVYRHSEVGTDRPATPLLRATIYDALRSATGIGCPELIRRAATEALASIAVDDDVAVIDAIRTADHELPMLSTEFDHKVWEESIATLM